MGRSWLWVWVMGCLVPTHTHTHRYPYSQPMVGYWYPCLSLEMLNTVLSPCSMETSGMVEDNDMNDPDVYWDALKGCNLWRGQLTQHLNRLWAIVTIVSSSQDTSWISANSLSLQKKVVFVSVIIQNANQKANYLQSMLGIFCNWPMCYKKSSRHLHTWNCQYPLTQSIVGFSCSHEKPAMPWRHSDIHY